MCGTGSCVANIEPEFSIGYAEQECSFVNDTATPSSYAPTLHYSAGYALLSGHGLGAQSPQQLQSWAPGQPGAVWELKRGVSTAQPTVSRLR